MQLWVRYAYCYVFFSTPSGDALSTRSGRYCAMSLERLIHRKPELAGKILDLRVAEHGFQLLFGDRQIGARPEP